MLPVDPTFFNGKDLTGWLGSMEAWSVADGILVGDRKVKNAVTDAVLYNPRKFRDFELHCRVLVTNAPKGKGCGLWFRSTITNLDAFAITGPFLGLGGDSWGSVSNITTHGKKNSPPPVEAIEEAALTADEFSDVMVKCVGRRLIVKLNGVLIVDEETDLPEEGTLMFQAARGSRIEVKDIRFGSTAK